MEKRLAYTKTYTKLYYLKMQFSFRVGVGVGV